MNHFGKKVGILGGGQLARMLAEAAHRLGIEPRIYCASEDEPAAQVAPSVTLGTWKQKSKLARFLKDSDLIAFESEFVSTEILAEAGGKKATFHPSLSSMKLLQDKLSQKKCMSELKIATSDYLPFDAQTEKLPSWLKRVDEHFKGQFVLKWSQMGYDGKGTWISGVANNPHTFCAQAMKQKIPLYAERKISFQKEVAILGCRSVSGEFVSYPLVISEQQTGICKSVVGPAIDYGVPREIEALAIRAARKLSDALQLVGTFAIEFFYVDHSTLLVNEIAPRVHNSGHYSLDACGTSQFENHWRALLGLPLGEPQAAGSFAMLNLLGPDFKKSLTASRIVLPPLAPTDHLHWYGKQVMKPGRKMGHLNAFSSESGIALSLLENLKQCEMNWFSILRGQHGKEK